MTYESPLKKIDDYVLKKYYGCVPNWILTELFDCTPSCVQHRAGELGLVRKQNLVSDNVMKVRAILKDKGFLFNPPIMKSQSRLKVLQFEGDKTCFFNFKFLARGSHIKNAKSLGFKGGKGDVFKVIYLRSNRFRVLQELLIRYPRLREFHHMFHRIVSNILGHDFIVRSNRGVKIIYDNNTYFLDEFMKLDLKKVEK